MKLHVKHYGESGSAVLVLHGLLGSARNWHTLATSLAREYRVTTVDLPNHGDSPRSASMSYPHMVEDVCGVVRVQTEQSVHIVGHSMGGKVAMALALTHPTMVRSLTVVDIAPVEYPDRYSTMIRALAELDVHSACSRAEIDERLAPRIPDKALRQFLLTNLTATSGGYRWRVDLQTLQRDLPRLLTFPAQLPKSPFTRPVLFIAGARSDYIGRHHHSPIRRLFPAARFARIDHAGHWPHVDNPRCFLETLRVFLREAAEANVTSRPG